MATLNRQLRSDGTPGSFANLLPPGDYQAEVVESAVIAASSGRGEILKLTFEVTAGDFRRRRLIEWLNIVNEHATAQRIAQVKLARLCVAAGLAGIADSEELHGIAVIIRVDIRPGSGGYGDNNIIKDYRALTAFKSPPRPPAATGGRPWDS